VASPKREFSIFFFFLHQEAFPDVFPIPWSEYTGKPVASPVNLDLHVISKSMSMHIFTLDVRHPALTPLEMVNHRLSVHVLANIRFHANAQVYAHFQNILKGQSHQIGL
jgi:hypothetical protein